MIWLSSLRGKKVICEGRCIGRVIMASANAALDMLDGIWTDRGLLGIRFISAECVCSVSRNAVVTDNGGQRIRMKPDRLFIRAVTTSGTRIGAVTDAAFDPETLAIRQLAITPSWPECLVHGRNYCRSYRCDPFSFRVIVAETEHGTEVES